MSKSRTNATGGSDEPAADGQAGGPGRFSVSLALLLFLLGGLLLTAGCISRSASSTDGSALLSGGFVPNWWPLVLVGLSLGVGFTAILYILAQVTGLPGIKSMAQHELHELGVSVLLILIVVGSLVAIGIFAQNITNGALLKSGTANFSGACEENQLNGLYNLTDKAHPENVLYADVDWFLGCMPNLNFFEIGTGHYGDKHLMYNDSLQAYQAINDPDGVGKTKGVMTTHLMNLYINLFSLEFMLGPISTFGVSGYVPGTLIATLSLDIAPNAGLTPVSEATIMLTDLIGVGLSSVFMQKVLLEFIHANALVVFLPLGLGFRAIPMLRKTGSTIIAAALVMYFIFPMSIWINSQVYASLNNPNHPVMQRWANYQTALQMCVPKPGEDQEAFVNRVQAQMVTDYQKNNNDLFDTIWNIFKSGQGGTSPGEKAAGADVSLPISSQHQLIESLNSNFNTIHRYVLNYGFGLGPTLPTRYFYEALVAQISNGMQWFALNLLFLINTLIISVTLFRDISTAIGGEPKIFGMSKLV